MKQIDFLVNGERIFGNLHLPDGDGPHPAVITAGPMTSVKEQVTGTYSHALARRGIAALAIDHRHFGESEGHPRQYEYYPHKIEDIQAALSQLATQPEIDDSRIGAVAICLGCGYMAHAIKNHANLRGFVAIAGYYRDVSAIQRENPSAFAEKVAQGSVARKHYELTGQVETIPAVSLDLDAAMTLQSTYDYYAKRAAHTNYTNAFAVMSREHYLQFDVQSIADELTMPFLMIHGPNALNPLWAEKFFNRVPGSKQKIAIQSDNQTDIYDNPDIVSEVSQHAVNFLEQHL